MALRACARVKRTSNSGPTIIISSNLKWLLALAQKNTIGPYLTCGSARRRTTLNKEYGLCATYPALLCVPENVTDNDLLEVAKFRSKQRLPALSWLDRGRHAAIVRAPGTLNNGTRTGADKHDACMHAHGFLHRQ